MSPKEAKELAKQYIKENSLTSDNAFEELTPQAKIRQISKKYY